MSTAGDPRHPKAFIAVTHDEFLLLFSAEARRRLAELADLEFAGPGAPALLPDRVAHDFDVLVTSWSTRTPAPGALRGARLRLVLHAGGSVRDLVSRADIDSGPVVSQAGADAMAGAVAEFSLTLALALLRNLHTHDRGMTARAGWDAAGHRMLGRSIQTRRIGIVGLSRPGSHFARMLRGLGCTDVCAYDPFTSEHAAAALGVTLLPLDDLVGRSEVLAIHAPATPETRHLIGREQLASMPDDSIIVNTARSWLVDQEALLAEVTSGRIAAALDVFDDEPLPTTSAFIGLPNVITTPHVAGGTRESRHAQGDAVVAELERHLRGEALAHAITAALYDRLA